MRRRREMVKIVTSREVDEVDEVVSVYGGGGEQGVRLFV